jgi:phosphatidylglycerol:prolipoprotein diacylglycerol transferase
VLPYINIPNINLGPIPIDIFGIIVGVAVLTGIWIARKRAKPMGIDPYKLESMINWMLLTGFACCHLLDVIFYHPDQIVADPLILIKFWDGLSSIGGLIGALLGILLWKKFKAPKEKLINYADLILSVYPISWVIGRMACATVHDHKGLAAAQPNIFTVAFPDGPHYDLGLLEMLYTVLIAATVVALWPKKRPPGTYIAVTSLMYAPARFFLDFLRARSGNTGDKRYFDLTFAQYLCVALFIYGIYMLIKSRRPDQSAAPAKRSAAASFMKT